MAAKPDPITDAELIELGDALWPAVREAVRAGLERFDEPYAEMARREAVAQTE